MMQGAMVPYANGAGDGSVLGLILESEGDYTRDNSMQTRRRSISYTNRLPVVDDRHDSSDSDRNQRRAERESRARQHRRHTSLTQAVNVESESSRPREQDVDTMYQNVNALALSFDASLSLHGTTAAPRLNSFPDNVYRPDIVAPTPIVGGPNVLHMWASRP
ncbi:hypothetical protein SERLA73DRAFT_188431 [Serpula lacrymans var. lacrymans S7.3]|uniref:Uncharacterized protein n=1 Tax=Serpula lacrymans var. lacrymans (strain S7.3) TaxID=936435 RepID=F8QBB2_SERL3|nr:hypothetical protein SERLA73DRAFT_188431 [Serpula lacrymans var. lacrymans S7.3]